MALRLLKAEDHTLMPWKNGLGTTREVAIGASTDPNAAFDWRLSIATVSASGPFSAFPGVDRTIAVLDGDGMRLRVDGSEITLTPATAPFSFPGEADIFATNLGAKTTDLNIMTRRSAFRHEMRLLVCGNTFSYTAAGALNFLIFNGSVVIRTNTGRQSVARFDVLAQLGEGEEVDILSPSPVGILAVSLEPVAAPD